jgi:hypothetical protein
MTARRNSRHTTARQLLVALTFTLFAVSLTATGCKKNDDEGTPQTQSINAEQTGDEGDNEQTEAPEDSPDQQANDTAAGSDAAGMDAGTPPDEQEEPQQVQQNVRSPSPEERAYNQAEIRRIRERLGLIPPQPLSIDGLMRTADIREITDFGGALNKLPIDGTLPGPHHNGYRMAADEGLGFALEVWTYMSDQATDTGYEQLQESLIAGTPLEEASPPTTLSVFAGVRQLVVKDNELNAVISVSCSEDICTTQHLQELASRVRQRM